LLQNKNTLLNLYYIAAFFVTFAPFPNVMRSILHFCIIILMVLPLYAQQKPNLAKNDNLQKSPALINKKSLNAKRVENPPKMDGYLDDDTWENIPIASDFIQNQTRPGEPSTQKTEVKVVYDDIALYIGAKMYDVSADSVLRELGKRDSEGNTDLFGIILDTYNDGINAFGFFVTPAGVQIDARYSAMGQDFNWNAVWESKVRVMDDGWVVEFKIPFSAIRFSNAEVQKWGVNFIRKIRRHREIAFWNNIDPAIDGLLNQSGYLENIEKIESPVRLSLTPYVSGYADIYKGKDEQYTTSTFNAGADIKYGLNESFTLDLTLIPDFGQVQSDNLVLNLSPFEIQFNDFRPFFTEGTELFNKGNLFYSRRVGGTPIHYYSVHNQMNDGEILVRNPASSQLLNAAKVSGRTEGGMGIGVFNATTTATYAEVENSKGEKRNILTDPLTNYSVMVFDQSLKNNSFISLVNTNVLREGYAYDANVTGTQFRLNNKSMKYSVSGRANLSQRLYSDTRGNENGYLYNIDAGKISGNFQYFAAHEVKSDKYNPRDMGFLLVNNEKWYTTGIRYNIFKPFWKVNNLYTRLNFSHSRRFENNHFQTIEIDANAWTTFTKHFFSTGLRLNSQPFESFDFFEPRTPGKYYMFPQNNGGSYWFSSDYRKRFALDGNLGYWKFNEDQRSSVNYRISPRFRVNDKLTFIYDYNLEIRRKDVGYVNRIENDIIFGKRNVQTTTNTLTSTYAFNHLLSLTLRTRHYWSNAIYGSYHILTEEGRLSESSYEFNHNVNFNVFNVDMVMIWNFAPGSEMSIVWKNSILTDNKNIEINYMDNLRSTIEAPQLNSISVKVLYFLDYLSLKKRK
jgi:hypothetical protein